ncbi:hypothetical protein Fcan01_18839 [Folsomia candida]|uniref:Uncharacterized protein n=1 Tax=Folsomia candida TaxID=158441 RepID=A0A226DPS1_FOLCA|nr:hypothetical protein Fcan01_18839 [Folsomia candida]
MSKTKVIVFRKGGRLKAGIQFWYGKERVDIVTEYTYLGVIFSQKGVFQKAAESFKKKGVVALASVWNTGFRGKITDWNSKIRLFESISLSCALYASQIWGLRYMDKMEELQMYFFKRLLGVERTVPGYLVRLETASPPFSLRVIKQAIKYWIKLMLMEEERYPRLCLEAMYKEWSDADMYAEIPHILTRIIDMKRQEDISAMHNSKRHSHYIKMWDDEMQPTKYLLLHLPQKHLNIIAQLRIFEMHSGKYLVVALLATVFTTTTEGNGALVRFATAKSTWTGVMEFISGVRAAFGKSKEFSDKQGFDDTQKGILQYIVVSAYQLEEMVKRLTAMVEEIEKNNAIMLEAGKEENKSDSNNYYLLAGILAVMSLNLAMCFMINMQAQAARRSNEQNVNIARA